MLKKYGYELALVAVIGFLFWANYEPGTYLTGWDNLQTELNPTLAVKRAFFSVWEEYQSFGLVSGLAHGSDLVRALFMWPFSFLLPQNMIRYFFHTLMLLVGSIGMLTFLRSLGFTKEKSLYAFIGSLFYIFNLGTVQLMALPLEAFSVFLAFLPWELWIFRKCVTKEAPHTHHVWSLRKKLFVLFLINLLATPQAYIQTIFVVYGIVMVAFTLGLWLTHFSWYTIRNTIIAAVIIGIVNLFWLLPQIYFLSTSGNVVKEAKSNVLSTDDLFYLNRDKSTYEHFGIMEGFYYDLNDSAGGQIFAPWKYHYMGDAEHMTQYILLAIALLGLFYIHKQSIPFIITLGVVAIALLPITPPFSFVNELLRQNELVNQIFRAPFTKFIVVYALVYTYFLTNGLIAIESLLIWITGFFKSKHTHRRTAYGLIIGVITLFTLFVYTYPSFLGYYYAPVMKTAIPKSYLELIGHMKTVDKNKRVALLPDYTFWGWFLHRWGYNGSGFLWYGIEQPIVSRTFDFWSDKSESYFWEIKTAIEAENVEQFELVLEKYNIDYLILDYSLLPVSSSIKGLQYDRLDQMLEKSQKVTIEKKWDNMLLISVIHTKKIDDFVSMGANLPNIGPAIKLTNEDSAYFRQGDYVTTTNQPYDFYYPFLDLTTQTRLPEKQWELKEQSSRFTLSATLQDVSPDMILNTTFAQEEISLFRNTDIITYNTHIDIEKIDNSVKVSMPKILIETYSPSIGITERCGQKEGQNDVNLIGTSVALASSGGNALCYGFFAPFLEQRYGYLVKVNNKNSEGRRMYFYTLDKTKVQGYIEDRLQRDEEYFVLSPKYFYGKGYNFIFQNTSYESIDAINTLNNLSVYSLPFNSLKSSYLYNPHTINTSYLQEYNNSFDATKKSYFYYKITVGKVKPNTTLILNQSYHQGWLAYKIDTNASFFDRFLPFKNGVEIPQHVMVNNWANGWELTENDSNKTMILIFWPQYLQFFGLAVLVFSLLLFIPIRVRKPQKQVFPSPPLQ